MYSPPGSPLIVYLPLTFVVAQPSPALLVAHTVAPTTTPLVAAFVTLPVI